ncbi:preprotein translocase subunit SecG [bacterium]|nr:preprotein translocase subunit SecG [bacterium]
MVTILIILHLLVAIGLIVSILMQSGQGGGLAASFGGGGGGFSEGTVFGGRGATAFLTKLTTGFGIAFAATTLLLHIFIGRAPITSQSVIQEKASESIPTEAPMTAPEDDME